MAVRIRADKKTIVCAAKSDQRASDTYIDDQLHYILAEEMKVLSVCGYDDGAELWEFHKATNIRKEPPPRRVMRTVQDYKCEDCNDLCAYTIIGRPPKNCVLCRGRLRKWGDRRQTQTPA